MLLVILIVGLIILVLVTFRSPTPNLSRLVSFVLLLGVALALVYVLLVQVLHVNPRPLALSIANELTEGKLIDLSTMVPAARGLDHVYRLETDADEGENEQDAAARDEWVVSYRYGIPGDSTKQTGGPWGGVVYDQDDCPLPALLPFELLSTNGRYLGEDEVSFAVENIIPYRDPLSGDRDRPEVIVAGMSNGVTRDLNIFRKTGMQANCDNRQQAQAAGPETESSIPVIYENVGSFQSTYALTRQGSNVTVLDQSAPDRSGIVIVKKYRPGNGSYFRPGTHVLLDPVEVGLGFAASQDNESSPIYYPERAVLAFYLALGSAKAKLEGAQAYLSDSARKRYDIQTDQFGLALPRQELERVLVGEIRYDASLSAEQACQERIVQVTIVGVRANGSSDLSSAHVVTWRVIGITNPKAMPYGCEWLLDELVP